MKKRKHNLEREVRWIKKNWAFAQVSNDVPGGYLVISIGRYETGGTGRIFTECQIKECIDYVKGLKAKKQLVSNSNICKSNTFGK